MADPETTQNQPVISGAAAFKQRATEADQGKVVELPSGLFVRVRRPSVTQLIKVGHIPADVAASMQAVTPGQPLKGDNMTKYLELMDLIVVHSVMEPKVVLSGAGENEVNVSEIEDLDKQFLMNYVQGGNADLTSFRTQPSS